MYDWFFVQYLAEFIILPVEDEFESLENGFQSIGSMSNTILVIDKTCIPINRPKINSEEYFNRKRFYSINFCVTVDYKKISDP